MLTEQEVRAFTPSDITPEITVANCKPGVTPHEVRQLIAETRARSFGNVNGAREAYNSFQRGMIGAPIVTETEPPQSFDEKLSSLSIF